MCGPAMAVIFCSKRSELRKITAYLTKFGYLSIFRRQKVESGWRSLYYHIVKVFFSLVAARVLMP